MMKRLFVAGAAALALVAPLASHAAADAAGTKKLKALFAADWEDTLKRNPTLATELGDLRYNDKLPEYSKAARDDADRAQRDALKKARTIQRAKLSPTDQVSLDLFIHGKQEAVEGQQFTGYRSSRLIGALWGAQSELADMCVQVPMDSARQGQDLLKRFAAYPKMVDDQIVQLREGMSLGWVPARPVLDRAVAHIDKQLAPAADASPWYEPFQRIRGDVSASDRDKLQATAREAIARDVQPPLRKLRTFIVDELRPKAPVEGAMKNYAGGDKVYEYLVRRRTTTSLGAKQVHEIGIRELTAIRGEMEGIMKQVKFEGDFRQFIKYLNTDPKFFYTEGDDLINGYRAIGKRIDAELPRLFAELPRVPYGVRAMPAFRGPDAAEYYDGPPEDGSKPGYFNANAQGLETKPKWGMASLTAHEAVPGHHLQNARSRELKGLPNFRRNNWYVAYGEGWALYAETLARDVGIYDDPYSLFGHLQARAFRAARLVVDTGIHNMGWTRQQAIDYMVERTGMGRGEISSEVDRYTSDPGQALGYMIGALKFRDLREKAKAKLGDKFSLRRYHNVVLDNGAVPMDVLEKIVDEWVARGGV